MRTSYAFFSTKGHHASHEFRDTISLKNAPCLAASRSSCMAGRASSGVISAMEASERWMEQMRATPSFQRAMEKDGRETFVFSG